MPLHKEPDVHHVSILHILHLYKYLPLFNEMLLKYKRLTCSFRIDHIPCVEV